MKKITAVLTVFTICISVFASCGTKSASAIYREYKNAEQETDALTSYTSSMCLEISCNLGEETYSTISETSQNVDLVGMRYAQTIDYSMPEYDMESSVTQYHKDGVTYYLDETQKYKYDEDDESAMSSFATVAGFDFSEEIFTSAKSENKNKTTTITINTDANEVTEFAKQFLAGVDNLTGIENDYSIKEVTLTLGINDGLLRSVSLACSSTFIYDENEASASVNLKLEFAKLSEDVIIPDDVNDYPYSTGDSTEVSDDESADELSEKDALAIEAAFALFEDDYQTKVSNYDELYKKACEEYGKEQIDSIIEIITAFSSLS